MSESVERPAVEEAGRKGGMTATPYAGSYARPLATTAASEGIYFGFSWTAWPAIWAGFFISAIVYVLLNTLGVAIGFTWLNNDAVTRGELSTAAGIWLIVVSLISFFVGGCVTGSMAALPGRGTGFMNGVLFACFTLVVFAVLTVSPVVSALPSLMRFWSMTGTPGPGLGQMPGAAMGQSVAWWSLLGMILVLLAAGFGGSVGARRAAVDPMERSHDTEAA